MPAWSLMNHMVADKVSALLDENDPYGPDETRMFSRDQALAIIHAAIWGYGSRSNSTAGAYAASNLYEALGLKNWTFDEEESAALHAFRARRMRRADGPEGGDSHAS